MSWSLFPSPFHSKSRQLISTSIWVWYWLWMWFFLSMVIFYSYWYLYCTHYFHDGLCSIWIVGRDTDSPCLLQHLDGRVVFIEHLFGPPEWCPTLIVVGPFVDIYSVLDCQEAMCTVCTVLSSSSINPTMRRSSHQGGLLSLVILRLFPSWHGSRTQVLLFVYLWLPCG